MSSFLWLGKKDNYSITFQIVINCNPPPSRLNTYIHKDTVDQITSNPLTKHYKWAFHQMISRKTNFKPQSVFRVETITSTQTRIFWLKNSMKFGFSFFAKKFDKIRKKKIRKKMWWTAQKFLSPTGRPLLWLT